ncbi:2Fe-2S iron-sulfur cluster-binding protein [Bacillus sp. REN10]|uniref:2Fe-2S iron-sulfur cluster-binding protein n=1 Tax=Bacillus sp. REN10 TaxID=2782541 RepID=UPI00193C64A3|nr:2Fe-2S iron-sulfur cluster-binding protein [Bacillus sp. REN10]
MKAFTKNVTVQSSETDSLLKAALKQQVSIPYACTKGGCGMCKVKIAEGQFSLGLCSKRALTDEEREAGYVLACQTYPESSTTIILA